MAVLLRASLALYGFIDLWWMKLWGFLMTQPWFQRLEAWCDSVWYVWWLLGIVDAFGVLWVTLKRYGLAHLDASQGKSAASAVPTPAMIFVHIPHLPRSRSVCWADSAARMAPSDNRHKRKGARVGRQS